MRNDKIVLTSKSRLDAKARQRMPVKECYCISEMPERRERVAGGEEQRNASEKPPRELVKIYCCENEEAGKSSLVATLLGCETLRRAGRITYLPNSEFLRRVQRKVNSHGRKKPSGVYSEVSSSRCCGGSGAETTRNKKTTGDSEESGRKGEKKGATESCVKSSRSGSLENSSESRGIVKKLESQKEGKAKPREGLKNLESSADGFGGERGKSGKIVRTISAHSRCCAGGKKDSERSRKGQKLENKKEQLSKIAYIGDCDCRIGGNWETGEETRWRLSRDRMSWRAVGESEERMRELSKFRRANYFETHGSVDTLVGSSRSSLQTIDPCELNDRLLAPAAAGVSGQKNIKRIHYYPSYVVRQEKHTDDTGCRKKNPSRSSCDFIGHVIDLGVLKIPCHFSSNFSFDSHQRRNESNC